MKKDIEIPVALGVYVAAIREWNEEFQCFDWNAYIINDTDTVLEMVFVSTKGYDGQTKTSVMRHGLGTIPLKSFSKIEYLQDDVLKLNNEFFITYFAQSDGKLYEKKFLFNKNSINEHATRDIPVINKKGVLGF